MVNDPIADFIIQVKNAGAVGKHTVSVPYSALKHAVADLLQSQGYLGEVSKKGKKGKKAKKTLEVGVVYENDTPRITGNKRLSKPSKRVYLGVKDIMPVRNGFGLLVLSTPEGIMSGPEAQKKNIGGEALFEIW